MSHVRIEVEGYFRSNQFVPVQTGSKSKNSDFNFHLENFQFFGHFSKIGDFFRSFLDQKWI